MDDSDISFCIITCSKLLYIMICLGRLGAGCKMRGESAALSRAGSNTWNEIHQIVLLPVRPGQAIERQNVTNRVPMF